MRFLSAIIVGAIALTFPTLICQTKARSASKPTTAPAPIDSGKTDELAQARNVSDDFLRALKIADLPEGAKILSSLQWITGDADQGENFYARPRFTETSPIFEELFDTDVAGVQGYKRVLDMKAVSEAGTQLMTRYFIFEFKDRRSNQWKVLETAIDRLDVEGNVAAYARSLHVTGVTSEQRNYLDYGHWLLLDGRTKEARGALATALTASTAVDSSVGWNSAAEDKVQIQALLSALGGITSE